MVDPLGPGDYAEALVVLRRIEAAVEAGELEVTGGLAGGLGAAIELLESLQQTDV